MLTALKCVICGLQGLTLPGTHRGSLLGCDGEERGIKSPWVFRHEVSIVARKLLELWAQVLSDVILTKVI